MQDLPLGLQMLGVRGRYGAPAADAAPYNLSKPAQDNFRRVVSDPDINSIYLSLTGLLAQWEMALALTRELCRVQSQPYLSADSTSENSKLGLRRQLATARALNNRRLDASESFEELEFRNIAYTVEMTGDTMDVTTSADVKYLGRDKYEWQDQLEKSEYWRKDPGKTYTLLHGPQNSYTSFDLNGKVTYWNIISVPTRYLPPKLCVPIPDPQEYQNWILQTYWLPTLRKYRLSSIPKRLTLI